MKYFNISAPVLEEIEANVCGDYLYFPISELPDPTQPESSNNGNYREYVEFWADTNEYRHSMSYHGDIEPYPEREKLNPDEFMAVLMHYVCKALFKY